MQLLKLYSFLLCLALFSKSVLAELAGTKAEAALLAQKQVEGRVLKVEQRGSKYKVKILQTSGRVVSVIINKKPKEKPKPDPTEQTEEK